MGCDIHSVAERRRAGGSWEPVEDAPVFVDHGYGRYAFVAGVRNSFDVPPISEPRGIPSDASAHAQEEYESWCTEAHSSSWLSIDELEAFDYDQKFEEWKARYDFKDEFQTTTYRDFLGPWFFENLAELRAAGVERVVFWFDN